MFPESENPSYYSDFRLFWVDSGGFMLFLVFYNGLGRVLREQCSGNIDFWCSLNCNL